MRRTASEVIRSLEMRVARLERQASRPDQSWKQSLQTMKNYFEREVGKKLSGVKVDVRTPSKSRSLAQHTNTATLSFKLNGRSVSLDAYEHQNMFGKAIYGFNLIAEGGRVVYESPKNAQPMDSKLVSKIVSMF